MDAKPANGQTTLFGEQALRTTTQHTAPEAAKTTLNRLHQAMLLFGDERTQALKRFLVNEGVGKDERFWRLANSLAALYPSKSKEKRWVEGVLARKKSFGF
jgi:hypothetical protein